MQGKHHPKSDPHSEGTCEHAVRVEELAERARNLTAARKYLLKRVAEQEEQLAIRRRLTTAPITDRRPRPSPKHHTRRGVPVLLLSDWHVEEPVDPPAVGGLNRFDLKIADACIGELPEAMAWLTRDSRFDCTDAVVWLGGDLYSGHIHEELVESCFLSPVQAVVWLQKRLVRMLRRMLALTKFERIHVICNDGNHGRLTKKMRVSTRTANSLEWLLYQTLSQRFEGEPRLTWQVAEGVYNYREIYGKLYAFAHGDTFRYQGGVGGISVPIRRGLNEDRKYRPIEHLCLGHFHQYTPGGEFTVNGSMIGIHPYSISIHAAPEPPRQAWFMLDSERGKCITTPVWFSAPRGV